MEHITIGKKYNEGKIAYVQCLKNDNLQSINIMYKCFLLICLYEGRLEFSVGGERISAAAPCFICFDETENPVLLSKTKARYKSIYFHPNFLNINMSFRMLRRREYGDIATTHDMFMLKPFLDKAYVIPICESQLEKVIFAADGLQNELENQRDWYWSCRGRSYFMEIIITLERMYGLLGYGEDNCNTDSTPSVKHPKLRDAVLYIEGHYMENLSLSIISSVSGLNHVTLTTLMKAELGVTTMEYLNNYRIKVAKKQLAFTSVPIKDVASRSGFKTVQHFGRVFKAKTGASPAAFRKNALQKRKDEIK